MVCHTLTVERLGAAPSPWPKVEFGQRTYLGNSFGIKHLASHKQRHIVLALLAEHVVGHCDQLRSLDSQSCLLKYLSFGASKYGFAMLQMATGKSPSSWDGSAVSARPSSSGQEITPTCAGASNAFAKDN